MKRIAISVIIVLAFVSVQMPGIYAQAITQSLRVIPGAVNGAVVERNGKALVVYGNPGTKKIQADLLLLTHFRRDVIWAGEQAVGKTTTVAAPAAERKYFTQQDSIWQNFRQARFHDYRNQTTKIGTRPWQVQQWVRGGETIRWEGIPITVLNTPGYTRGAVSYIMELDGKRVAFVGDLIYGDGQIFDLYSLQDELPGVDGYHGYAARIGKLITSLQTIADAKPDLLIPVRGPVINTPVASIEKLIHRLQALYRNYLSITAQRWNHSDRMITLSNTVFNEPNAAEWMPFSKDIVNNLPPWLKHIGNSKLIIADNGHAFLIDAGTKSLVRDLSLLRELGQIKQLDGLFITHYHDDHTDVINDIVREFKCPVYVTRELEGILRSPEAFRMPCMTTEPVSTLTVMEEGAQLKWNEFTFTFHYFPGQTIYHDALLAERSGGISVFFLGDSFSPAGIDDYCFQNRNLLQAGTGYFYCLDLLRKLPQNTLLCNQHIKHLFRFSPQQLDVMTKTLQDRVDIMKELLPWEDINFGIDEQWISIHPYGQRLNGSKTITLTARIYNHANEVRTFSIRPNLPEGFELAGKIQPLTIAPHREGEQKIVLKVKPSRPEGLAVITVDVKFGAWDLRQWTETYVEW